MRAIIKRVTHGKRKGEWRFVLKAGNGETVAVSETYRNRQDMNHTLLTYFPQFLWVEPKK